MKTPKPLLAALLLVGAVASAASGPRAQVRHGTNDAHHGAVVALVRGERILCSGTLFTPRVVVTAAHCLDEATPPEVWVGAGPGAWTERHAVRAQVQHPAWDAALVRHDVAVLLLEAPITSVKPLPLAASLPETEGLLVTVSGFGHPAFGEGEQLRRQGTARLVLRSPTTFRTEPAPAQVCHGDSGGAALVSVGGEEVLAGITSAGDATCEGWATFMRADAYAPDFLEPFARGLDGAATGERCFPGITACQDGGACLPAPDEPALAFCARPCAATPDCPADMVCEPRGRQCVHAAPSPGALGGVCEQDARCASGWCSAGACTRSCTEGQDSTCPAGFACVREDVGASRVSLCRATAATASGCAASGPSASDTGVLVALLLGLASRKRGGAAPTGL